MHRSSRAGRVPGRRALVAIAALPLALLVTAVALRGRIAEALLAHALRNAFGLHVTIDRVGGTFVSGVELQGVKAAAETGDGPVVLFEARHLEARYSAATLLRGTGGFLDSLEVTLAGARLDLDLTLSRPGAPREAPAPLAEAVERAPGLPALPRLRVRDSRLLLRGPGYEIEADGLRGDVGPPDAAREQPVEVAAERFALRHPALREGVIPVSIRGRYSARGVAVDAGRLGGAAVVENAVLRLGERPGELEVGGDFRAWDGSGRFRMGRRGPDTEVQWQTRGLDLRPQDVLVHPGLAALRGRLTSQGSVRLAEDGLPSLAGTASLDWEGARIGDQRVDRLRVDASAEGGTILVRDAEGRIGDNEIRVQRAALDASSLFAGRWRSLLAAASGSLSASLGNVPEFLALWGVRPWSAGVAVPSHRLVLDGTVETGTVRIARGELAAGGGKASIEALALTLPPEGRGWGETAFVGNAAVDIRRLEELSVLFPVPRLAGSLKGKVSGTGTFARPEGSAVVSGRGVTFAGRLIGDVDLRVRGAGERVEIDSLEARQGGNRLSIRDAGFSAGGVAARGWSSLKDSLAGSFDLRSSDLPALAALAGIPTARIARLPAPHQVKVVGTVRDGSVALSSASVAAAGATVALGATRVSLPGSWKEWRREAAFAGEADAAVPDLVPLAAFFGLPRLTGSLRAHATFSGNASAPSAALEAEAGGLAVAGHRVGDVAARVGLNGPVVTLEALEVVQGGDRLRGHGAYDLGKGVVLDAEADVALSDVAPWVAEFAPARLGAGAGSFPVSGRLHAVLRAPGPLPGGPIAVEAEISDGRIQEVRAVRGTVHGQLTVDGAFGRPRVAAATVAVRLDGEAGRRSGHVSLDATYEPGSLHIEAFEAKGSGGLALLAGGTLPVDLAGEGFLAPGPLSVSARATMPHLDDVSVLLPPAYRLAGSLAADLSVAGSWNQPQLRVELSAEGVDLASGSRFVPPGPFALRGAVTWSASEARAEAVRVDSALLSCSLSGAWTSPPTIASLLDAKGAAATGSLAIRASFSTPDLGWLRKSVDGLRALRGRAAGEVTVQGPVRDPSFSGSARLDGGELRYGDLPPLDAVTARLSASGRKVTIEELDGNVGGSPFTLSGSVDLATPADPVLDLRLRGTNALFYRAEGLRIRGDGDLTLRGPVSGLSLAGDIALADSVFQRTFSVVDLLPGADGGKTDAPKRPQGSLADLSFPEPPLRDMRFDVRLTAIKPFRIQTTVVRGRAVPDLRLGGTGLLPVVRGSVNFSAVRLALPSGIMDFERGSLLLRNGPIGAAELDFGGRMQARGYEVTAQISGTLENPEIIVTSLPPLPQEELLMFVLTGAPPGSATADGGSVAAMATPLAVYLGKGVLEQLLGGGGSWGDALQSRLEVSVGRETTRSGGMTLESRLLLLRNLLRRHSSLYVTAEQDRYDQDNIGVKLIVRFR